MKVKTLIGIVLATIVTALHAPAENAFPPAKGQHTILLAEAQSAVAQPEGSATASTPSDIATNGNPFLSGPVVTALEFLSQGSNWMTAAYGTMNDKATKFGGGVAVGYKVNDFLAPTLRLDYYDGRIFMPSASLQLQVPIKLLGKLTVIPFAISGIATPIAGKGSSDGSAVGIFGAGAAVQLSTKFDLIADAEKWTGFDGYQFRFGALYKW
jgi:hypothetical protein